MKRCKRCLKEKEPEAFNKELRVKDGLTAVCRTCNVEISTQWQITNRDRYNQIQTNWRMRHPEQALQKGRAWRAANRERSNAFSKKWVRANREKVRARTQRWVQANRARIQLYAQERRAREAGASGSTTPEQLQARIDYYGGCCWICRVPYQAIDHVISLKDGGTNWPSNLRPICKACNSAKGSKNPAVFLRQRAQASA
jgi:5-methylcytosine-specific restriction endonuclease McrA